MKEMFQIILTCAVSSIFRCVSVYLILPLWWQCDKKGTLKGIHNNTIRHTHTHTYVKTHTHTKMHIYNVKKFTDARGCIFIREIHLCHSGFSFFTFSLITLILHSFDLYYLFAANVCIFNFIFSHYCSFYTFYC